MRTKLTLLTMKTIPVSFLLSGILLPAVCWAQGPPPAGGGDRFRHGDSPPRPFIDAWKMADADHDGFIAQAEFNAMPRVLNLPEEMRGNIFKRLDKNGDGKLSREELMELGRPHDGEPLKRLWELDADKSGGVSLEEFKEGQIMKKIPPERLAELFKRLDTDGDGLITPKDRPNMPRGDERNRPNGPEGRHFDQGGEPLHVEPGRMGNIIQKLDTNGDGSLSFEEFRSGPFAKDLTEDEQEERFEKLDKNGDHKISKEDLPTPAPAGDSR